MRAFHCLWTKPFFVCNPQARFAPEAFELLTTALSALLWRRENGSIAMLCDSTAAAFYEQYHLTGLWDDGLHTVLDDIDDDIDPDIFWAAGKLYALRSFGAPCVMLDTDFIVWQSLASLLRDSTLACIHREGLTPDVYPPVEQLPAFPRDALRTLDWSVLPANTALSWFGDRTFTQEYTDRAIHLMRSASGADNRLTYMVFAEQRFLSMLAKEKGVRLDALSDLASLFSGGQKLFTHVWGFKQQMREDPILYHDFCRRCAVRLAADFPVESEPLRSVPALSGYFAQL